MLKNMINKIFITLVLRNYFCIFMSEIKCKQRENVRMHVNNSRVCLHYGFYTLCIINHILFKISLFLLKF